MAIWLFDDDDAAASGTASAPPDASSDASLDIVDDDEEKISDMEASDSSTGIVDPSPAEESSTSAGHYMHGNFGLASVAFLVMSFTGF